MDMFKELYPSDMYKINFETSLSWLPFYSTLKEMIQQINTDIVKLDDEDVFFGWYEKEELNMIIHAVFKNETMHVNNAILFTPNKKINPFQILTTIAKSFRMASICLNLEMKKSEWEEVLKKNDYSIIETGEFECRLTYHTGLVLGGGGARGSYQIGVWRALKKLGIDFDMISGASVGALNGGLIVQGDLESSETMWKNITTEKVMALPSAKKNNFPLIKEIVTEFEKLTISAIREKGVSTKPLLDLISHLLVPEKMKESSYEFYLVTTEIKKMEETVISLKDMDDTTLPLWLLASASFFPVMKACLVDGHYYIDGGYRNNVPKDILIKRGATELIIVDVKGPGVTKPVKVPPTVVETYLKSTWDLGDVLLFDGECAEWNMALGYLETQKAFGYYKGIRYTFNKKEYKSKNLKLSRDFFLFLKHNPVFSKWFERKKELEIWDWLIKNKVTPEIVGILLIESLAKKMAIRPTQVYEIEEIEELLVKEVKDKEMSELPFEEMNHSLLDTVSKLIKEIPPITEHQLLLYYYTYFKQKKPSNEMLFLLMDISWYTVLEALFLLFLEKRND